MVLSRSGAAVFVSEIDGAVAGWIEVRQREPLLVTDGSEAEITGLVVDSHFRRSGLGRGLVERAESWARDRGCRSLRVRSNVLRQDAHDFYEKLGYVKAKTQFVFGKVLTNASGRTETASPPWFFEDAEVVLRLGVEVSSENRVAFLDFCRRAFPIYESSSENRMFLYEDAADPCRFDEVGYYRTIEDYRRGEDAVKNDPVQVRLIEEWRGLLKSPPKVTVSRRIPLDRRVILGNTI